MASGINASKAISYERLLKILKECEYNRCRVIKCNGTDCKKCKMDTLNITEEEYNELFN